SRLFSMPSPREKNVAGRGVEQPGLCWPACAAHGAKPPALPPEPRARGRSAPAEAREAPSAFAEKGPAAPLADTQAAEIRQDLASIQLQLQRLLAGQSEIQEAVLRPWHVNGEETFPKAKDLHPGKRQTGSSMMSPGSVNSIQENSDEIKKVALQRLFDLAEDHEEKMRKMKRQRSHQKVSEMMSPQHLEMTVDTIMAAIIGLNAVFIGISSDHSDNSISWLVVDACFSFLFIVELAFKIGIHGCVQHFSGPGFVMNCGDFILITADLAQLILQLAFSGSSELLDNAPPASIFRMVRLLKIARVLRLVNMDVFKDLLQMMQGMMGGMSTLLWAMIFFLLIVYVTALLFRELLGRRDVPNVKEWFDSVPRAMYSTFRCSVGDCSTLSGQPIFEFVQKEMGTVYSLIYCLFVFAVTIGLFNVISAIFVETTMAAAQKMAQEKKIAKHGDEKLLAARVTRFITCILKYSDRGELKHARFSEAVNELFEIEVARSVIDSTIKDPEAIQVLNDLDIHPQDRARLSDIFDPDNGGTVQLSDVAAGTRRQAFADSGASPEEATSFAWTL
ncbi:unnamed protein product, partial [Effrenium voratum]